jgi:hypothetical protein
MKTRPVSVTVIGCIFVLVGFVGLAYHSRDFKTSHLFQSDVLLIALVRLLAIVFGVFMLRGSNWARWAALAWMSLHVVLSAFHSKQELMMHAILLVVFAYFLMRRQAAEYFVGAQV